MFLTRSVIAEDAVERGTIISHEERHCVKHRYNSFFPYFLTLQLSFKTAQPFACTSKNIDNIKWNKHVTVNQRISSYERRFVIKHREYEASRYFGNWNCKTLSKTFSHCRLTLYQEFSSLSMFLSVVLLDRWVTSTLFLTE